MVIGNAYSQRISGNFVSLPFDWECNRRGTYNAKVVTVVGVLPDIFAVDHDVFSNSLLQSSMEFIAKCGRDRSRYARHPGRRHDGCDHRDTASGAGDYQIFVERRLQGSRIRNSQHRVARFDVVSDSKSRLGLRGMTDPPI